MGKHASQPHPKTNPGEYNNEAHRGTGKRQKLMPPAVGTGYNKKTPHAEAIPHQGKGAPEGGYEKDAHTHAHHGYGGRAVGKTGDNLPMEYHTQLQGEGKKNPPFGNITHGHANVGFAEHHSHPKGEAHNFNPPAAGNAHGYGHSSGQKHGALRNSGHGGAHRIGKR